ncbi:MAG: Rieske 2Fe-2S domain-containing protein [Microcoleaceae cyanobacterium MO_207.B10]|nr:Rieske 2Fe-2S domain-containing protein [Microcoleaceae cyanobacterium MO_207.B10]
MTLTPNITEISKQTDITLTPQTNQQFNWRNCWYPVTFIQDLPKNRPYSFSLYDEPLVLFRNAAGQLTCLSDRCPHRAAKLSDGQIIEGKIECLYHGWQFGSGGECLQIPQLPTGAKMPEKACVKSFLVVEKQGMVWMWAGKAETADENTIPILPDLEKPGFVYSQKVSELPFDQGFLIEQVLDPAHLNFSHHGSQGNRKNAQPLEMEILESSIAGIKARFRGTRNPDEFWKYLTFFAPNLVLLNFSIEDKDWRFGLAWYSMPVGKNRCRVLTCSYRNFFQWKNKLTPRWLTHLGQSKILEEDLHLVMGQQESIERSQKSLKELFLPLKTSDTILLEYRKWLDRFGSSLPFYHGYTTYKLGKNLGNSQDEELSMARYAHHTQFCNSCSRTHQITIQLKKIFVGVAIALAGMAIVTDEFLIKLLLVSASISSIGLAVAANKLKTKFERSYTRK